MIRKQFTILLLCFIPLYLHPQNNYSRYNFLNLQDNTLKNTENANHYNYLMDKFADLCQNKKEKISILHIGDSHMQAGFYSSEIKQNFQNYFTTDSLADMGLIFPYSAANTNNPADFKTTSSGNWMAHKAVTSKTKCKLGVTGIALCTNDTLASLTISLRDYYPMKQYAFDHARIFCSYPDSSYKIEINPAAKVMQAESFLNIEFKDFTDSIKIKIEKNNPTDTSHFKMTGIQLINSNHSLSYHAAGVNGAKAKSYLSCELFSDQLRVLNPDWVIISLGTNEAYNQNLKKEPFQKNLKELVHRIQNNTDSTWILLNTPGDAMYKRDKRNPNNNLVRKEIINVARETNCSYWDFYQVMGGNQSIDAWYSSELTAHDKLHLNKSGYQVKGNLFFDAFLSSFQPFFKAKLKNK